jgi:hypothetical protein
MTYPDPQDFAKPVSFRLTQPQRGVSCVTYGRQERRSFPSATVVDGVSFIRDLVLVRAQSYVFWVNRADLEEVGS